MSDIKLFMINGETVTQLEGQSVALEKSLQTLIEKHLDVFLGIRFLATEYSTGKTHGGRIDTLGIDENGCPCIIEYKRSSNENVINQGLFYLDWLLDHKGEFELLVLKKYGQEVADSIEWSSPRLLCIAGDFTKYDAHAVQQINRNIELLRYLRFGEELLLLELVNAVQATDGDSEEPTVVGGKTKPKQKDKTVSEQLAQASQPLVDLYEALKATCIGFGDDVQMKTLKLYVAFKLSVGALKPATHGRVQNQQVNGSSVDGCSAAGSMAHAHGRAVPEHAMLKEMRLWAGFATWRHPSYTLGWYNGVDSGKPGDFSSACQLTSRGRIASRNRNMASGRCQSAGNVPGAFLMRFWPRWHAPLPGD